MKLKMNPFKRMPLSWKFGVLAVIALAMVSYPFYAYLKSAQESISFAQREASGVKPMRVLSEIARDMGAHQALTNAVLLGNERAAADRTARAGKLRQTMGEFEAQLPQINDEKIRQAWSKIAQDWAALAAAVESRTADPKKVFDDHAELVYRVRAVIELVGDWSYLTLDPDVDTYYLMSVSQVDLPRLTSTLTELRAFAAGRLSAARAQAGVKNAPEAVSLADRQRIGSLLTQADRELIVVTNNMNKVYGKTPEMERELTAVVQAHAATVRDMLAVTKRELLDNPGATFDPSEYLRVTGVQADAGLKMADDVLKVLLNALTNRVADLRGNQMTIAAEILALTLLGAFAGVLVVRSVTQPMNHLRNVIDKVKAGDGKARAELDGTDEVAALAQQFNAMLDEREAVSAKVQAENETLNGSVLNLLQAVAQLSRKDLTVKVPVTEDVTGPVADALNLLTNETAKVLQQVSDISADVTMASLRVKEQSDTVQASAHTEREQIERTAQSLEQNAQTMVTIAELAQNCNTAADRAIKTTAQALSTVTDTVGGINNTRETIRETEKRIKRLGERSQEISVAVNLINTIAERTHILALNAAMHAASAGEAGRGFAVVADEVQRLAENARQATQQIATLVSNIQVETADTVNTMNAAIGQVVEGSKLAEQAGRQMQVTQETTAELVAAVRNIAQQSEQQAKASRALAADASAIKESTLKTSKELNEQGEQTSRLVEYARSLISSVRVFKLSST